MPQKRFKIQDLTQPRQTVQARPVEGFVQFAQPPPDFNADILDLDPVVKGIAGELQKKKAQDDADDRREGLEFAQANTDLLVDIRSQLDEATAGLTDRGDIARAQKDALRRMTEAGLIPPQANPAFLIGMAESEAQRTIQRAAENLRGRVSKYTVLSDENGDLVDPPNPQEAVDAEFKAILDSPLVRHSRIAREMVAEARPKIEGAFHGDVSAARLSAQESRSRAVRGAEWAQGTERGGRSYSGYLALEQPDVDPTVVLESLNQLRDEYRSKGVPHAGQELVASVTAWAEKNIEQNPVGVRRVLNRIGKFEVAPGVPLDADDRPFAVKLAQLRSQATDHEGEATLRAGRFQQVLGQGITTAYQGLFVRQMDEDPTASRSDLHERTLAALESDPQFLALMAGAEATEIPEAVMGGLRADSTRIYTEGIENLKQDDTNNIALYNRLRADGVPKEQAIAQISGLSPAARDQITRTDDGALDRLKGGVGWAEVDALRTVAPQDVSTEALFQLDRLGTAFDSQLAALATEGFAAGKSASQVLASPEATALRDRMRAEVEAVTKPVDEGVAAYIAALANNDLATADEIMSTLGPKLAPKLSVGLAKERSTALERQANMLPRNPVYQSTLNSLRRTVAAATADEDAVTQARAIDEVERDFLLLTGSAVGETIKGLAGPARDEALATMVVGKSDELLAGLYDEDTLKKVRALRASRPELVKFEAAQDDFSRFVGSGSKGLALEGLPTYVSSPNELFWFWERTKDPIRLRERVLTKLGSEAFRDMNKPETSIKERREQLAKFAGVAGAFTPEDIVAGKGTFRIPVDTMTAFHARNASSKAIDFSGQSPEEFLAERGIKFEANPKYKPAGIPRPAFAFVTFELETTDLHPTLTRIFSDIDKLGAWIQDTPPEARFKVYQNLGMVVDDIAKTDALFAKYQTKLITESY